MESLLDHGLMTRLSGFVAALAYFSTILSIAAKKLDPNYQPPNIVTFLLWGLVDAALAFTMWKQDLHGGWWQALFFSVGNFVVVWFLLDSKTYKKEWSLVEKLTVVVVIALIVTYFSAGPYWTSWIAIAAITGSMAPMIRDLWITKQKSSLLPWILFLSSSVIMLMGIPISKWLDPSGGIPALQSIFGNLILCFLIARTRRKYRYRFN